MNYKYSLDSSSKKYICPECQKKTFVKYIDNKTKQFIRFDVGRCDREINCGYHYSPKAYFQDHGWKYENRNTNETVKRNVSKNVPKQAFQNVSYIEKAIFERSLYSDYLPTENYFIDYLKQIFEEQIVSELVSRFRIGSSKHWIGSTVFWQIDETDRIRSGKIILYDKNSGKRSKNITWVHSVLKLKCFNLKQCLFGLHQINQFPDKIIGIVESEKTAIIMTGVSIQLNILNNYIWMATGSLNMLKEELLKPIMQKKIVLFPDLGIDNYSKGSPFHQWKVKYEYLKNKGCKIKISDLLEKNAHSNEKEKGYDVADYVFSEK